MKLVQIFARSGNTAVYISKLEQVQQRPAPRDGWELDPEEAGLAQPDEGRLWGT